MILVIERCPGVLLINLVFDGFNFLGWSCSIKLALGAKANLGFIDGHDTKPENNEIEAKKWN